MASRRADTQKMVRIRISINGAERIVDLWHMLVERARAIVASGRASGPALTKKGNLLWVVASPSSRHRHAVRFMQDGSIRCCKQEFPALCSHVLAVLWMQDKVRPVAVPPDSGGDA